MDLATPSGGKASDSRADRRTKSFQSQSPGASGRRDSHRRNVSDHRGTRERRPEVGRGNDHLASFVDTHVVGGDRRQVPSASDTADTRLTPTPTVSSLVSHVLSALGSGPKATSGPVAPVQPPTLWAMLAWVRREIGHIAALPSPPPHPRPALQTGELNQSVSTLAVSPLGTPEQLEAEKIAAQTVNTLPVKLMKLVLRHSFLSTARQQFPDGPDAENLAALNNAVDEYAMAAAFQQQLLNPMAPTVVTQVAPPHTWYGMDVGGSRILYDNPDTIYRFMSVNASSSYVITGRFPNYDPPTGFRPTRPSVCWRAWPARRRRS